MTFGPFLALVLLVLFIAVLPRWPWTRGWSFRPAIVYGMLLATVVILIALQIL